jgi:hypothetical protein
MVVLVGESAVMTGAIDGVTDCAIGLLATAEVPNAVVTLTVK